MRQVRVSARSARLRFHGCDPEYIRDVCHGRCCEGSAGLMVVVHPTEAAAVAAAGATISPYLSLIAQGGLLRPADPAARGAKQICPFKAPDHLCSLHGGAKPFGCVASPFTLNGNDTLIVRNRYKLLRCYDDGPRLPAYVAFRVSLDLIFGAAEAARICGHLEEGGGDLKAAMPELSWRILHDNDAAKRS